ncbi:hypothetical protein ANCCAN_22051 [Ancylostoma caninum]|uniref:MADF domain-containing protein n=1 Tax=Ancylostoma caninum TaxID=29170 RepID=A0A368FJ07_ANCCA|nr:hypothetical protein ANCCAN_22051 [Ancylostoma caninum]
MSFELKCELIAAVEANECLWNPYCEDYHKGIKRSEAWTNIQRDLGMKGYQVHLMVMKNYWKSLRDHWKKRQYPSAEGRKPWVFSDRMDFLLECAAPPGSRVRRPRSSSCAPGPSSSDDVPPSNSAVGTPTDSPEYEEQVYDEGYDGSSASHDIRGSDEGNVQELHSGTSDSLVDEKPVIARRNMDNSPSIFGIAARKRKVEYSEHGAVKQSPHMLRESSGGSCDIVSEKYQNFGRMVSSMLMDLPSDVANDRMASICAILFQNGNEQLVEQAGRSQRRRGRQLILR